jgi:hypothetical protein
VRLVKVITWVLVFALCAALGAVVAANTDPFPPGVDDPGVRPSADGSPAEDPGGSWGGEEPRPGG